MHDYFWLVNFATGNLTKGVSAWEWGAWRGGAGGLGRLVGQQVDKFSFTALLTMLFLSLLLFPSLLVILGMELLGSL